MPFRFARRLASAVAAAAVLAACGFSGNSSNIPAQPTATPTPTFQPSFLYVTEATDPTLGTNGGAVRVYNIATNGGLGNPVVPPPPAAGQPTPGVGTFAVVNPRRVILHPEKNVIYVAGANQIFAFGVGGDGTLRLCAPVPNPQCVTNPLPGGAPLDMTITQSTSGQYVLYVSYQGNANNVEFQTRISAYPLEDDGELPENPTTQAQTIDSASYQSAAVTQDFAYVSDLGANVMRQFVVGAGGKLPDPATSPTPVGAPPSPPPTPTPVGQTPTPSPGFFKAFGPGRILAVAVPAPSPAHPVLYVVQVNQKRIGMYPISTPTPPGQTPAPGQPTPVQTGALSDGPISESNTRGFYNSLLVVPSPDQSSIFGHLYGAAFQNGQIDFYTLATDGTIMDDTQGSTSPDPASYPSGLAFFAPPEPAPHTVGVMYVSVLGHNRVDAYRVDSNGDLASLPFSSTQPIDGTSPSDVLLFCPSCRPTPTPEPTGEPTPVPSAASG